MLQPNIFEAENYEYLSIELLSAYMKKKTVVRFHGAHVNFDCGKFDTFISFDWPSTFIEFIWKSNNL